MTGFALEPPASPRWLHRWAVGTVCATFILLFLGSIVTTFSVGMADPIWPTYPWHLLLISWEEPKAGFLVEHTHRLAGYLVGCGIIVLTVGLWRGESRRWLRWLGTAALVGVILQGLLGGFRVKLDEWMGAKLALIHGSFASVVFSVLVSLAVFTSHSWAEAVPAAEGPAGKRLRIGTTIVTALVFLQIVLGAILRHTYSPLGQRGHLLTAFAVVAGVVWLTREIFEWPARNRALTVAATLLAVLVTCQILLGVEAWMLKYFTASAPAGQALVRTGHVLTGHLVLATVVVVTLYSYRLSVPASVPAAAGVVGRLKGFLLREPVGAD